MSDVTTGRVVVIAHGPDNCFPVDSTMEGITKQTEGSSRVHIITYVHPLN